MEFSFGSLFTLVDWILLFKFWVIIERSLLLSRRESFVVDSFLLTIEVVKDICFVLSMWLVVCSMLEIFVVFKACDWVIVTEEWAICSVFSILELDFSGSNLKVDLSTSIFEVDFSNSNSFVDFSGFNHLLIFQVSIHLMFRNCLFYFWSWFFCF